MNPPVSQKPDSGTSDAGQSGRRRPVRRRYRRRRRRTPAPIRWLRDGPAGELLELVAMPLRERPLPIVLTAAALGVILALAVVTEPVPYQQKRERSAMGGGFHQGSQLDHDSQRNQEEPSAHPAGAGGFLWWHP